MSTPRPQGTASTTGDRAAPSRGRRFPVHALVVTDQEGIWQWFRSRDPDKARRRAWRYAEALARCGGARVLPVTVVDTSAPLAGRAHPASRPTLTPPRPTPGGPP
jgi:hypothetical protein